MKVTEELTMEPRPLDIVVGSLYILNKNGGRYCGVEAKVTKLLPHKEVMAKFFDEYGDEIEFTFDHEELFAVDDREENGRKMLRVEAPTVVPKQDRIKDAMENNEDLRVASRVFVREMALIGLCDEESLLKVLKAAKRRLAVEYLDVKPAGRFYRAPSGTAAAAAMNENTDVVNLADGGGDVY